MRVAAAVPAATPSGLAVSIVHSSTPSQPPRLVSRQAPHDPVALRSRRRGSSRRRAPCARCRDRRSASPRSRGPAPTRRPRARPRRPPQRSAAGSASATAIRLRRPLPPPASASSSRRSIRSRPAFQKPGSVRSTPTIAPSSSGEHRAAGAQHLDVGGDEALALLLVAAIDREREQVPEGVGVDVAGRVDEVRHVGPPGAVVGGELDRVAEQVGLGRRARPPRRRRPRARRTRGARGGCGPRSGSSRPGGRPRRRRRRACGRAAPGAPSRRAPARAAGRGRSSRRRSRRSRRPSAGSRTRRSPAAAPARRARRGRARGPWSARRPAARCS